MTRTATIALVGALLGAAGTSGSAQSPSNPYARDPKQAVDDAYTKKMKIGRAHV